MKKRVVVALGGNALGIKIADQKVAVSVAADHIADLVEAGYEVIIVHGNGPQVGMMQLAFAQGSRVDDNVESMPLVETIAMTQGYIGYHLQNALLNKFNQRGLKQSVVTITTQIEVDAQDECFNQPTKPIGPFYTKEEIMAQGVEHYVEDAGRGYRQVVASPNPLNIIEIESITQSVESGNVVICCGGGGVPVIKTENGLVGIDAVIDKDAASAKLAHEMNADLLLILTAVDHAALNFGQDNEESINLVSFEDMKTYSNEGHFAPGSMLPKVGASIEFVEKNPESKAIITSLDRVSDAINHDYGTQIHK